MIAVSIIWFVGMKLALPDLNDGKDIFAFLSLTSPIYFGWTIWWIWKGFRKDTRNKESKYFYKNSDTPKEVLLNNEPGQDYNAKKRCENCGTEYSSSDYDHNAEIWKCSDCKSEIPKIELLPEDIPRKENDLKPGVKIAIRLSLFVIWPIIWLFLFSFYGAIRSDLRRGILEFLHNTVGMENIYTVTQTYGVISTIVFAILFYILVKGFILITKETK